MKKLILLVAALTLPFSALAADGDAITDANTTTNQGNGAYWSTAYVFCDKKLAASPNTCAEFDLNAKGIGMPAAFVVSIDSHTNCDPGYDIDIRGTTLSGGTEQHLWGTINATTSSLQVTGPVHRFLVGTTTDAGCSVAGANTGLTANIVLYYKRD